MIRKQKPHVAYSVTWLKLAECISRQEKERALGVYRLLSRSFEGSAMKLQLEGDILLAFDDQGNAIRCYAQAAAVYEEEGAFVQAIAMHDHLFALTGDQKYIEQSLSLGAGAKESTH